MTMLDLYHFSDIINHFFGEAFAEIEEEEEQQNQDEDDLADDNNPFNS